VPPGKSEAPLSLPSRAEEVSKDEVKVTRRARHHRHHMVVVCATGIGGRGGTRWLMGEA
jgi:hypothetical protein